MSAVISILIAPPWAFLYAWAELPINFEFLMIATALGALLVLVDLSAPPSFDPVVVSTLLFLKVVPLISMLPHDSIAPP